MEKIATVNVIKKTGQYNLNIVSFKDNEKGNEEAELHFKAILKDLCLNIFNIDYFVKEGLYYNGDYAVYIVHSA